MMMDDEVETNKLWRVRKALIEILHSRGYLVSQDELDQTLDQFKETFGDKPSENRPARAEMGIGVAHKDDPNVQLRVFFPSELMCRVKTINACCNDMELGNIHHGIFVVQVGLTTLAKQALEAIQPEYVLEAFSESELLAGQHFGTQTAAGTYCNINGGDAEGYTKRPSWGDYKF